MQKRLLDSCDVPILSGTTTNQVRQPGSTVLPHGHAVPTGLQAVGLAHPPGRLRRSAARISSVPVHEVDATWTVPNSVIAPALGRNLSAGATATKSVQLIEPGTLYCRT